MSKKRNVYSDVNIFSISEVKEFFVSEELISIDDDFIMARQSDSMNQQMLKYPCRIDAFWAVFCIKGDIRFSINLKDYDIHDNTLVINMPGNIIQYKSLNEDIDKQVDMVIFAISRDYMFDLSFDLNKVYGDVMKILKNPCFVLTEEEIVLASKYVKLIYDIISGDFIYKKECVRLLISSIFYLFSSFIRDRLKNEKSEDIKGSSRHRKMFEIFIALVSEHHLRERRLSFYADKLCITPRYLSKVVKDVSGKSAVEYIDKFVILEAQHLLRHSDLGIKEIADRLNFEDPSSFYKYFKSQVGMTPNQYRRQ